MPKASISDVKAKLSAYLDVVRNGDEVLITDRGRAVARLAPVVGAAMNDSRRDALIRSGRLRPPLAPLSPDALAAAHPRDPDGHSLAALLDERRSGW